MRVDLEGDDPEAGLKMLDQDRAVGRRVLRHSGREPAAVVRVQGDVEALERFGVALAGREDAGERPVRGVDEPVVGEPDGALGGGEPLARRPSPLSTLLSKYASGGKGSRSSASWRSQYVSASTRSSA